MNMADVLKKMVMMFAEMLASANHPFRQWSSNSQAVLAAILSELHKKSVNLNLDQETSVTTPGWETNTDFLSQETTALAAWNHVPSGDYPADLDSALWWHAPQWLGNNQHSWPQTGELVESALWWHAPQWLRNDQHLWPQIYVPNANVEEEHLRTLHAGPGLMLSTLRQRFWPLGGRNLVRCIVHVPALEQNQSRWNRAAGAYSTWSRQSRGASWPTLGGIEQFLVQL